MTIAIIPARGGSRRIPGKNKKMFHGKPIIAYSIMTAQESGLFDRVVVSTDDADIAEIAEDYGAEVIIRDPRLCADDVGTQEVAKDALVELNITDGLACVIYATAPMISIEQMEIGMESAKLGKRQYAHAVDRDYHDAGQWYWGRVESFLNEVPLDGNSNKVFIPERTICDINTYLDWGRAVEMYAKLHEVLT